MTAGASAATDLVLIGIAFVEPLHAIGQLLIRFTDELRERPACEVAILVVHRLDARAIDGQQLSAEQVELPTQDDELAKHLPKRGAVHPAEGGDRAEIRLQVPQKPDHL